MNFTVASSDINFGLSQVTRALLPRAAKLAFEGVFIETSEEGVQLTCTNGEMTIKTMIAAAVRDDGCALLPAKLLSELLRKLEGEIDIQVAGTTKAVISAQGSKTDMLCMDAADFPEIQDIQGGSVTSLPQNKLRDAVGRIIFAVSADETRRILTGCLMETYREEVRFVCLDGFRLAMQRVYATHDLPQGKEAYAAVLPGAIIGEIGRMVADVEEPITLHCTASHLMASFGRTKVYCPLIPGEYINYKQILPTTWTTAIRVDKTHLSGAIERAALMAREGNNNLLRLKVEEENLTIQASAERGAVVEHIGIDFEGSPMDIAFNARYLMDVIKNVDTVDMAMRFNTNVSPCVICPVNGNQYTYLVLPVRVGVE
ncbi:MAG: DNA polymerase III subunit beta [Christensenellales bacterium]